MKSVSSKKYQIELFRPNKEKKIQIRQANSLINNVEKYIRAATIRYDRISKFVYICQKY